ncbi:histonelysine Nmethyltransferase SETMARlike [Trichonephila clavipes]|nr:histonelysine Nmethyltransferase SETMARlike [Trichonephila clavipes]
MAAEWAGLVSSQAKSVGVHSQKVMSGGELRKKKFMAVVSISREVSIWQFQIYARCQGISDVKVSPPPVIENVDKITEIIEVDRQVSNHSITQELKINHKTVLSHLSKVGFKKKLDVWVQHQLTPKNMMNRISICEALDKRNEIDPFLKQKGQTLHSDLYCQQLDRLKLVTDQKRPELANRRVQKRTVPSGQRQATHVYSQSPETLGA